MSIRRDIKSGFLVIEEYKIYGKLTDPRPCLDKEKGDVRLFNTREDARICIESLKLAHPKPQNYEGEFIRYVIYDMAKPLNYAKVAVRLLKAFDELEGKNQNINVYDILYPRKPDKLKFNF